MPTRAERSHFMRHAMKGGMNMKEANVRYQQILQQHGAGWFSDFLGGVKKGLSTVAKIATPFAPLLNSVAPGAGNIITGANALLNQEGEGITEQRQLSKQKRIYSADGVPGLTGGGPMSKRMRPGKLKEAINVPLFQAPDQQPPAPAPPVVGGKIRRRRAKGSGFKLAGDRL